MERSQSLLNRFFKNSPQLGLLENILKAEPEIEQKEFYKGKKKKKSTALINLKKAHRQKPVSHLPAFIFQENLRSV